MRLRFQKGDWLAVSMVVCLAVLVMLLFLPKRSDDAAVEIYQNGELVKTMPLSEDGVFTLHGSFTNEITVSGGKVCFSASDCPGQDCVLCGSISAAGRSLVCLPNAVEVRITAGGDVDFVVG